MAHHSPPQFTVSFTNALVCLYLIFIYAVKQCTCVVLNMSEEPKLRLVNWATMQSALVICLGTLNSNKVLSVM